MTRLLLLVVIAYLVWLGIERLLDKLRVAAGVTARPLRPPAPPPDSPSGAETLVRCAGCGVHVLPSRTLTAAGGQRFCSEECRRRIAQSA
jgi:hypothetical protein